MISRLWRGWTSPENAGAYEELLRTRILPGIHRVDGYRGAYLLRHDAGAEDRKSTRLNSSHIQKSRMPSSA